MIPLNTSPPASSSNQGSCPITRKAGHLDVCAALKTIRSLCSHAESSRSLADGVGAEVRAFEKNIRGRSRDFGFAAAHDAGKSDSLLSVRNDEDRRVKLALNAVQSCQLFVQPGAADDDLTALKLVRIEGMQRMAQVPS